MKISVSDWGVAEWALSGSLSVALLSVFMPWVSLGIYSENGISQGTFLLCGLFAYPAIGLLTGRFINKTVACACAVLAALLTLLYIDSKSSVEILDSSFDAAGLGAYFFLLASLVCIGGIVGYKNPDRLGSEQYPSERYVDAIIQRSIEFARSALDLASSAGQKLAKRFRTFVTIDDQERNRRLILGLVGGGWTAFWLSLALYEEGLTPRGTGWILFTYFLYRSFAPDLYAVVLGPLLRMYAWAAGATIVAIAIPVLSGNRPNGLVEWLGFLGALSVFALPIFIYALHKRSERKTRDHQQAGNYLGSSESGDGGNSSSNSALSLERDIRRRTALWLLLYLMALLSPFFIIVASFFSLLSDAQTLFFWSDASTGFFIVSFVVGCCGVPVMSHRLFKFKFKPKRPPPSPCKRQPPTP